MHNQFEVITNNVPRLLLDYDQLPENVAKDEFDYIEDESGTFFKYKGNYYDLGEFMRVTDTMALHDNKLKEWHGYMGDSYFSGILIRYTEHEDEIVVGQFFS